MRPVDILTFVFLAFLLTITAVFSKQIPDINRILSIYLFLSTALIILMFLKKRYDGKILAFIYNLVYPYLAVVLIFDSLGGLIRYINPATYDHLLIRLDYMIFKAHPTIVLEPLVNPVITEILQYAYVSYYFLPIILGISLIIKKKDPELERSIFLVVLCFFLSYIGYILIPAIGPRYTMNHLQSVDLHGVFLRDIIDNTINALEGIKRDAFPSGHTAVTLVVLYLSYRFQKVLFRPFLPIVMALMISTVYLRYHYVVDVFAGIFLAILTIFAGEKYYNWWENRINSKSQSPITNNQ